ncbi:sensor histidine kinase [Gracilibacillus alcaliphilus]|uniref:sensor histidine kinase n=1 Tax=Gracilibacillus alcaliphilus TaxID=1401441 RepID=UPI00195E3E66|nr:HAMP domain-containing sensor histidine kinase [Gracilibacillus alcaliphilus]MBM7677657.1 signal transduction histidine kinase [Gracilibacillus alcaliphilus]
MRLRTKLQLLLTIFIFAVVLLLNGAIYLIYQHQVNTSEMNRIKQEAETIMEALTKEEASEIAKEDLLRAFLPANGMIRVISQEEAQPIHSAYRQKSFEAWPFAFTTTEQQTLNHDEDGTPYVQISIPIIWDDGSVVTLQVSEALYHTADTLQTLQLVLLITTGLMLLPTLFFGYLLAGFVIKPIQSLTDKIKDNPKNGKWEKLSLNRKKNDEIAEMQHAYNAMIDRIEENIQKQERFVSDASHELRTPLSVITSYAELLQRRAKERPELMDEATEAILSESERMKHLTDQMLTLAKSQNQGSLLFQDINISQLVREAIRALSTAYQREVHYQNMEEVDLHYSGDKAMIHQAIYILIDNACKYSEEQVSVQTANQDNILTISVMDQGVGLSEADKEHIFERFYRVDKARSRKAGGTGLGLAICYQIVHVHGGTITIDSELGKGSTFSIQLPI